MRELWQYHTTPPHNSDRSKPPMLIRSSQFIGIRKEIMILSKCIDTSPIYAISTKKRKREQTSALHIVSLIA